MKAWMPASRNVATILIALLPSLYFAGCSEKSNYHVEFSNNCLSVIQEATINYGDCRLDFGYVSSKLSKDDLFVGDNYPVPESATVSWVTPDGVEHSQEVMVKQHVPTDAKLPTIIFTIDEQNKVTVTVANG